jgi:NADPH:quinone reductase-like Zn-dependent oxidoreductase
MRAVVITKHGPPEVLQVQERAAPRPGAGEVGIEVAAAGVNFADIMARQGLYEAAPKPPSVVGYEVAGTVVEVGADVAGITPGDRVIAGTRFNGYQEQAVARAADVIPLPAAMTFEQGAAIPVNYSTAYAALIRFGSLPEGGRVLINAAAGGVGIAATQIARRHGAEIYGTASPGKHEAIRGFGVDHALDYTQPDWERGLPKFDLVMDAIGGRSFATSYGLLRPGGVLVCFGAAAVVSGEKRNLVQAVRTLMQMPKFKPRDMMEESKTVVGLNALALWDEWGSLGPLIGPLVEMIGDGTVQPVVSDAVPFANAPEAHRIIQQRRNVGKVVLVPDRP